MRIMAILPGPSEGLLSADELRQELKSNKEYLMKFASLGTDIDVFLPKGVKKLNRGRDIALLVPDAVEIAIQGEKDGFDAIIINAI